jgi:hypothetical protein
VSPYAKGRKALLTTAAYKTSLCRKFKFIYCGVYTTYILILMQITGLSNRKDKSIRTFLHPLQPAVWAKIYLVRFEVCTAVTMKNGVFWDVTPFGSCKNRRFGGT